MHSGISFLLANEDVKIIADLKKKAGNKIVLNYDCSSIAGASWEWRT